MKVTFYSNFLTHHQLPFCLEMKKKLGDDFKFVSTVKIFQWRLDLGFENLDDQYDFVIKAYENETEYHKAKQLALDSDVVIIGSITDELIVERLKQDKITFRYRARVFHYPDGFWNTVLDRKNLKLFYDRHIKFRKNKNLYLLCANAHGPNDFNFLHLYKNKIYRWGYFLKTNTYDINHLMQQKENNKKIGIIWVARFIKCKHPEIVIKLAKNLKKQNYHFVIKMLGNGKLEKKIRRKVKKEHLEDVIEMVGHVPSDKVKDYMEKANIFIGTSDFQEGWGAVINESMNAGCAIVANEQMGSVPILIKHRKNGMIYHKYSQLENNVKELIKSPELRKKLSINAYETITNEWTSQIAVENLIKLFTAIINGKECEIKEGPASKANNYIRKK